MIVIRDNLVVGLEDQLPKDIFKEYKDPICEGLDRYSSVEYVYPALDDQNIYRIVEKDILKGTRITLVNLSKKRIIGEEKF